jgi:SAM-dependent methyltransferase
MSCDARTQLVADGYDTMAETWERWSSHIGNDPRADWLAKLVARLRDGCAVVELGCGNGTAETRVLAERFDLTGVDLSEEQLRRARKRVPGARFVQADVTRVEFADSSLDAVCAFYVFNHVPRELLAVVFDRIHRWLRPGGFFLATFGASDVEGWHGDWLGVPMYFSSFTPERTRALLGSFEMLEDEVVAISEADGEATFHWVLARR